MYRVVHLNKSRFELSANTARGRQVKSNDSSNYSTKSFRLDLLATAHAKGDARRSGLVMKGLGAA